MKTETILSAMEKANSRLWFIRHEEDLAFMYFGEGGLEDYAEYYSNEWVGLARKYAKFKAEVLRRSK